VAAEPKVQITAGVNQFLGNFDQPETSGVHAQPFLPPGLGHAKQTETDLEIIGQNLDLQLGRVGSNRLLLS
jgi:hypothetical protein